MASEVRAWKLAQSQRQWSDAAEAESGQNLHSGYPEPLRNQRGRHEPQDRHPVHPLQPGTQKGQSSRLEANLRVPVLRGRDVGADSHPAKVLQPLQPANHASERQCGVAADRVQNLSLAPDQIEGRQNRRNPTLQGSFQRGHNLLPQQPDADSVLHPRLPKRNLQNAHHPGGVGEKEQDLAEQYTVLHPAYLLQPAAELFGLREDARTPASLWLEHKRGQRAARRQ